MASVYMLKSVDSEDPQVLVTIAANIEIALVDFGKELSKILTLQMPDEPCEATYMLAEHDHRKGPFWVNYKIPVYEAVWIKPLEE